MQQSKLARLRAVMQEARLDAYIVPSSDPHQSEYVAEHWNSRAWLSAFTGSAGLLIVAQDWAGLWTDSRYFLQAETQLNDSGIELQKILPNATTTYHDYLNEHLLPGSRVGVDGRLFSVQQLDRLERKLADYDLEVVSDQDLIPQIWFNRPALPKAAIFDFPTEYAGQSRTEKLQSIRQKMHDKKVDTYLVSALDEIAWLFNLRGNDTPFNPVFYAYACVQDQLAYLFVDLEKINSTLAQQLEKEQIKVRPYTDFPKFLQRLSEQRTAFLDPSTFPSQSYDLLPTETVEEKSFIQIQKAIKNEVEIQHLRHTMEVDGVALVHLYRWLEEALKTRTVSEFEIGKQLTHFRRQHDDFVSPSFASIVGYNTNGAIVHYRAEKENCVQVQADGMLLIDSGGQYLTGTTDITRTTALGTPTAAQKRHFTLVLKGHIALASIQFPIGTNGHQLDTLARQFLWREQLNYGHGTGHGVGFFLNVHESPPSISSSSTRLTKLEAGMVFSNEPGYYEDGEYGIRIENLLLCVTANEEGDFLKFETLSLFPMDRQLIAIELLNKEEIEWLNGYHEEVFERLSPNLSKVESEWLQAQCCAI